MANEKTSERLNRWDIAALWWRTLKISVMRYNNSGALFMAAAIAFYGLICLGPFGILVAALLQRIFRGDTSYYVWLQQTVAEYGGEAAKQIMVQINGLLRVNPAGHLANVVGAVALIWAGIRLFEMVQLSLTAAWPGRRLRTIIIRKLVAVVMMAVAGLLLAILVIVRASTATIAAWLSQFPHVNIHALMPRLSYSLGAAIAAIAYFLLYKYMPVQKVATRAALAGALCAAILWQAISPIFTYMITRSLAVNPIYGGLGSVVLFGLWAFAGAQVLLYGAQFAAAYEHVFVYRRPRGEDDTLIDTTRRRYQLSCFGDFETVAEAVLAELELDRNPRACDIAPGERETVNGIILGGGRVSHAFAEAVGADIKGLIEIEGKPSVEYVVEAMRAVPHMRKIVLVGDKAAYSGLAVADKLDAIIEEGPSISHNLLRAIKFFSEDRKILLATSDTPLLTSEALCDFLQKCDPEADLSYPVTRRQPTRRLFGRRVWIYLPLRDGWVTHTCNILFDPRLVLKNQDFVERFLERRKDLWAAAGSVGLGFMLRFLLSWYLPFLRYDMNTIGHRIEAFTGAHKCQGVILDYPEIALDLDKPSDVTEVVDFLQREKESHAGGENPEPEGARPG